LKSLAASDSSPDLCQEPLPGPREGGQLPEWYHKYRTIGMTKIIRPAHQRTWPEGAGRRLPAAQEGDQVGKLGLVEPAGKAAHRRKRGLPPAPRPAQRRRPRPGARSAPRRGKATIWRISLSVSGPPYSCAQAVMTVLGRPGRMMAHRTSSEAWASSVLAEEGDHHFVGISLPAPAHNNRQLGASLFFLYQIFKIASWFL